MNRRHFLVGMGCGTLAVGMGGAGLADMTPALPMATEERINLALERLQQGYHCSQCVFEPYAAELGLSVETGRKLTAPLAGGGIPGGNCGAIGSGYLILGAKFGSELPRTPDGQGHEEMLHMYAKVHQFVDQFTTQYGSITCLGLTGVNVFVTEGRQLGREAGAFANCGKYISTAISIMDQLIAQG
ncbi:MAG: C_GCAxxG_C_C family protein [Desulfovibrio sp.]|nr:MAG: C_GCAxxG_C_C family protein [Desulfovibrio sp.]